MAAQAIFHARMPWKQGRAYLKFKGLLTPLEQTPVPFWGQTTQIWSNLSPIAPKTRLQS